MIKKIFFFLALSCLIVSCGKKVDPIYKDHEKKKKKLNQLTIAELQKIEPKLSNEVLKIFDLKNSVNSKKSYGGTSFDNIKKMIIKYKKTKND